MPDIHKGMGVKWKGEYYIIIDFKHTHMGRGGANIRIKMKNLKTGRVINQNFKDTDELEEVRLERVPATFSYSTGDTYVFYNNETYEEIHFTKEHIGDDIYYLKEGLEVNLLYADEELLGIELPNFVDLKVVDTPPGYKGDTVSAGTKPAVLETGLKINVPMFINPGDVIRIDTRTGEYIERIG